MINDRYDKTLVILIVLTVAALAVMLAGRGTAGDEGEGFSSPDRALERAIAYQARVDFLGRLYGPVEELRRGGKLQEALFKLDELALRYPGEAHGKIVKGEILYAMGALDESLASFVEGVKQNGDYVDRKSPLSRRKEIDRVAEEGLRVIGARSKANPGNRSLEASLKNVNYLRSRLAGGCE